MAKVGHICIDLLLDKAHTAVHASSSNSANAKQPHLMTSSQESSDVHSVSNEFLGGMLLSSPFDHELGQVVNNSPAVLNKVASLCENDSLSDIELVVCCADGDVTRRSFPAHKLILCCSSDVLKVMLMNPCWPDSSRPSIELHEEQSCVPVRFTVACCEVGAVNKLNDCGINVCSGAKKNCTILQ